MHTALEWTKWEWNKNSSDDNIGLLLHFFRVNLKWPCIEKCSIKNGGQKKSACGAANAAFIVCLHAILKINSFKLFLPHIFSIYTCICFIFFHTFGRPNTDGHENHICWSKLVNSHRSDHQSFELFSKKTSNFTAKDIFAAGASKVTVVAIAHSSEKKTNISNYFFFARAHNFINRQHARANKILPYKKYLKLNRKGSRSQYIWFFLSLSLRTKTSHIAFIQFRLYWGRKNGIRMWSTSHGIPSDFYETYYI